MKSPLVRPTLHAWSPELRRALMRVRPEFFAWPADQQERYAVSMPRKDRAALQQALLAELFGRVCRTTRAAARAADRLTPEEQDIWNATILPLAGIGEDHFYFNESFAEGTSILDFTTLRDFDEDDHRVQQDLHGKNDPAYVPKPYRGALYLRWARLFVDGRFTYATLSMAAGYLYTELDKAGAELLEQRIPHTYVPGANHGKAVAGGWEWDMRVDARGQEQVLDELRRCVWDYANTRCEVLLEEYYTSGIAGVYFLDQSELTEQNVHFVFTNTLALSQVRLRTFVRDCRAQERPPSELAVRVAAERAALAAFIDAQHAAIVRDHDPKVAKLRRRAKVIIANGAFE